MQFKKHTLKTAHRAEVYSVLSHLVINKWSKRVNYSHYEVNIGAQLVTQRLQANSQKDKVLCQAGRWWHLATPRLGREAQTKSFLEKTYFEHASDPIAGNHVVGFMPISLKVWLRANWTTENGYWGFWIINTSNNIIAWQKILQQHHHIAKIFRQHHPSVKILWQHHIIIVH